MIWMKEVADTMHSNAAKVTLGTFMSQFIDAHIECFKVGLGLVKSFELTVVRQAIFNEMRTEGGSQNASQEPILSRLIKQRYSKDQATIHKATFTQQKAEREEKRQTTKDSIKRSLDDFLRQQQGPPQQQGRPQPKGGNFGDTSHIPCNSNGGGATAPMGTPASLGISLLRGPSARQEGMHSNCLPRQQAIPAGAWGPSQAPSARPLESKQQDVQGPLADSEGLINPELDEPAQV